MTERSSAATLIYDGDCGLCQRAVARVRAWDREHRLAYLPFEDRDSVRRFGIGLPALAAAMHLVLPDGRVFSGADAVPELGRLLPGKGWWTWGFLVPGVRPLARHLYGRIARRRRCAVRALPARGQEGQVRPGGGAVTTAELTAEGVRTALRSVKDPELNLNIMDLGLVYDVDLDDGNVHIRMTLTSPGCPAGPQIMNDIHQTVRPLPGVKDVDIEIVWEPYWTPEKIEPKIRAMMGF